MTTGITGSGRLIVHCQNARKPDSGACHGYSQWWCCSETSGDPYIRNNRLLGTNPLHDSSFDVMLKTCTTGKHHALDSPSVHYFNALRDLD